VSKLLKMSGDPGAVAEALYVRCLSRKPTPTESVRIASRIANSADKASALEDLCWALLNSNEFLFNH
jgi:hypothetical protein